MRWPARALRAFLAYAALMLLVVPQTVPADEPPLAGTVLRVFDGDTLEVENIGKVRLIGIDVPETEESERDTFYLRQGLSRATLRQVSREARAFAFANAKGRRVSLTLDRESRDRHGRLLAYVHLPDGRLLNRLLLENGLASVYRRFDFRLKADFLAAEKDARQRGIGLWHPL